MAINWGKAFQRTSQSKYKKEAADKKLKRAIPAAIEGETLKCATNESLIRKVAKHYLQQLHAEYSKGNIKAKGCEIPLQPYPSALMPHINSISIQHFFNYIAEVMNSRLPEGVRIRYANKQIGYEPAPPPGKGAPIIAPHFNLIVDEPKKSQPTKTKGYDETLRSLLEGAKNA